MKNALLIDFGSTYTKLTAVDLVDEEIIGTVKSPTTVETDVLVGFNKALKQLYNDVEGIPHEFEFKLACSSAAGGLKMIAIGLVPELTAEAAKRAALGAGARVLATYSFELTKREMEEISNKKPDIILLAGGTDGGNKNCIIHNARMITNYLKDVPLIIAGNIKARDEIEGILQEADIYYQISENVMPRLNVLNVEPVRETIKELFIAMIIEAKGMKRIEKLIGQVIMPTPAAVLKAAQLLADGTDKEEGLGDLLVIDIGGATTDIHSISNPDAIRPGVIMRGLQEPYAKRTVEGDLGMRVSAQSLWEAAGSRRIKKYIPDANCDIEACCKLLAKNIESLPKNDEERIFDEALGCVSAEIAVERHAGTIESQYTPTGLVSIQEGKDLQGVKYIIGTGGVLVYSDNPVRILNAALANEENSPCLKPQDPKICLDKSYILSAMGLLSKSYPDKAIRIMKKYLVNV